MRFIILGGTGEVGRAVVDALVRSEACQHITMLNRRTVAELESTEKIEQVVVDTDAPDFFQRVQELASGHDAAISCLGVGKGTAKIPEAEWKKIEVDLVGGYASACKAAGVEVFALLLAVGISLDGTDSFIKYTRVLSKKYRAVADVGFKKLAAFKPGNIVGNKHTPGWAAWLGQFVPDSFGFGNIDQKVIGEAFAVYLTQAAARQSESIVEYGNAEMKEMLKTSEQR